MAELVFRSTTRGGRDFFEVTDDGSGKDRYNIKTDGSMDYASTVDEVLAQLVFDGAWRVNYDKIEVDELGIGDEYKEIVKLIRQKYNWLYNLPKGSKGRQFYFDIGRYFSNGLKKGIPSDKIFNMIDDYLKATNFKESKKSARKSLKESRESILDKEFYDLVEQGYIYDEDENGMNMSYGEYVAVADDLWEVLADELKYYRDFPSAYDAYMEILDNTSDDAKMFMGVSDDDYFYFEINEDENTYSFSGEVPSVLEKLFKEFQKETDLERV